jgi:tetratricopeptide (TPR) repeat protein
LAALSVLSMSRGAWGQVAEADAVKGEVNINPPAVVHATVTLSNLQGGANIASAPVSADGSFELRHVPYGQYRLTVSGSDDRPLHQELISIHERQQPIEIRLTITGQPKPASGTVSAQELLHPPSKQARKAVTAAQKLSDSGEHEKAAGQLQKAVELSPDYPDAWINLGAEHIYLKRYEQALGELAQASEISRPTPMILCDMAFAQYSLQRFAEGTRSVREALKLDPSSAPAHYLLGSFLALDRNTRAEGIQHLEIAARSMPAARAALERVRRESAQVVPHP